MRRPYFFALLFALAAAVFYFSVVHQPVCLIPQTYKLGEMDARFNLTPEDALAYLRKAEAVWEEVAEQDLFVYDEASNLTINFIFDDRQERTIAEEAKRAALDQKESTSASVGAEYKKLIKEYDSARIDFEADSAGYETKLARFNSKVAAYNAAGGAPSAEFADLKVEENKLATEARALQVRTNTLATLASKINEVSERGNQLIAQYNAGVVDYNHAFASPYEFTQGDYQGESINIYKFSDENELQRVLAHEFGHALGIGHVEGASSIMYALMEKQPTIPVLSPEDTEALVDACSPQTQISNWFYRFSRSIITFNK